MVFPLKFLCNNGGNNFPVAAGKSGTDFWISNSLPGKFDPDASHRIANGFIVDLHTFASPMKLCIGIHDHKLIFLPDNARKRICAELGRIALYRGAIGLIRFWKLLFNR